MEKKPWFSKTIIVNALVALAVILATFGFIPGVAEWMQANASIMGQWGGGGNAAVARG